MFAWITSLMSSAGISAVLLLMFLENVFPPIPSELIMPLAGFTAARGDMNWALALAAGALGSLAGATFWYWIGKKIGTERLKRWTKDYGRWLTMTTRDVEKADQWFDKHGHWAVMTGRMVPGIRTLISVPAGISGMKLPTFLAFSAIGTIGWTGMLFAAGYALQSEYDRISNWIGPVSNAVVGIMLAVYLYRVITFKPN